MTFRPVYGNFEWLKKVPSGGNGADIETEFTEIYRRVTSYLFQ